MFLENVCRFVTASRAPDVIQTINFVYETKKQEASDTHFDAMYKIYCVVEGSGILHAPYKDTKVKKGDIFFTFPSVSYSIESCGDFRYLYISFLGFRANQLLDRMQIGGNNFHFCDFCDILPVWMNCLEMSDPNNLDIISESALLFALSAIEHRIQGESVSGGTKNSLLVIKKIIDDNLQNRELDLDLISRECAYNKNYISAMFKKHMNVTVRQYINTIRIQAACSLMQKNVTCIKDVAYQCGFSDPLYFSKVFKSKMGINPKEFIAGIKNGQ